MSELSRLLLFNYYLIIIIQSKVKERATSHRQEVGVKYNLLKMTN